MREIERFVVRAKDGQAFTVVRVDYHGAPTYQTLDGKPVVQLGETIFKLLKYDLVIERVG